MKENRGTILVVEDDRNQREIVKTILAKEGFYVEDAETGKRADPPLGSWQRLRFDRQNGRQIPDDGLPPVAGVSRGIYLPARGPEIHAAREAPATCGRRPPSGISRRPRPRHTRCRDQLGTVRDARRA